MLKKSIYLFHLPIYPNQFTFFDIGKNIAYTKQFNPIIDGINESIEFLKKIISQANNLNNVKTLVFSGTYLNYLEQHEAAILKDLKDKISTNSVELLGSTYHHSLSSVISKTIFIEEVEFWNKTCSRIFGLSSTTFFNSLVIYYDDLEVILSELNFTSCFVPTNNWHLNARSNKQWFKSKNKLLNLLPVDITSTQSDFEFFNVIGHPYLQKANTSSHKNTDSVFMKDMYLNDSKKEKQKYLVPLPISCDINGLTVLGCTQNPLQRTIIQNVIELKKRHDDKKEKQAYQNIYLFCSIDFLKSMDINQNTHQAYSNFLSITNMLADLDLKLQTKN